MARKLKEDLNRPSCLSGCILAVLVCFAAFAVPNFRQAKVRVMDARFRNSSKNLSAGLEAYLKVYAQLPPPGPAASEYVVSDKVVPEKLHRLTTLPNADQLTTAPTIFYDPFMPGFLRHPSPHIYFRDDETDNFLLISSGPDKDYDFDPRLHLAPGGQIDLPLLLPIVYDPSNGTFSGGDLFRSREGYLRYFFHEAAQNRSG